MNWDMVRQIHSSGLVDVESHTLGHLMLTQLTPEQERNEIFESKRILEEKLNKKINVFAYPYGDLNDQVVNLVKEAGYKLAFSTRIGSDLHSNERFILKRVSINGFDSFDVFKAKLDN
jgi:peptidoglycan/xylan/chitin deacetylase (PgdA/CDA1 family)